MGFVNVEEVHQPDAGFIGAGGAADEGDGFVQHVDGFFEATQDVGAFFLLAEAEPGAADDNFQLVADVDTDKLVDAEGAGDAVNNGEHVGAEVGLQRGVLVEVVEDDLGDGVAF